MGAGWGTRSPSTASLSTLADTVGTGQQGGAGGSGSTPHALLLSTAEAVVGRKPAFSDLPQNAGRVQVGPVCGMGVSVLTRPWSCCGLPRIGAYVGHCMPAGCRRVVCVPLVSVVCLKGQLRCEACGVTAATRSKSVRMWLSG